MISFNSASNVTMDNSNTLTQVSGQMLNTNSPVSALDVNNVSPGDENQKDTFGKPDVTNINNFSPINPNMALVNAVASQTEGFTTNIPSNMNLASDGDSGVATGTEMVKFV